MPNKLKLSLILTVALCAIWFSGCTTHNPNFNPGQPPSPTNEPYSVDPRLLSISNTVAQIKQAAAPLNPYDALTDYAVKGVFGLIGLVSGGVLAYRNRQAVVNTMAAGVVKAGAGQAVLDHAGTTDQFQAVAQAVNNYAGANQSAAGTTKT